ncbi:unnamed protein product, partial [marine sediment metagenome]
EEAGDTLTHTFIKEPWPVCETRWFTFKGDVDTLWTASAGPIFKKHRVAPPTTQDFYPDAHPEVSSFDGYTQIPRSYYTWAQLRTKEANDKWDGITLMLVGFQDRPRTDRWGQIWRSIFTFDTSIIPPGSTILSATLKLYIDCPYCQIPGCAVNIFSSDPEAENAISLPDHLSLGSIPFSTNLELEGYLEEQWVEFP